MTSANTSTLGARASKEKPRHKGDLRPKGSNGVDVDLKRLLGAFYTPEKLAEILVRWALDETTGAIVDPSFGGCAFLAAAVRELARKGVKEPGRLVYGVDVDPGCIQHVRTNGQLLEANCIIHDFLDLAPEDMPGAPFTAVVGNPPFVRHHWLKDDMRVVARRIANQRDASLPETASLWAYFVVHALTFLEDGGRLALLVPEAILQADYAAAVRDILEANFRQVRLVHIRERLFDGTDEPVVVVTGEGYGDRGTIEPPRFFRRLHDLRGWSHGKTKQVLAGGPTAGSPAGHGGAGRARLAVSGDLLDRLEDRLHAGDAAHVGPAGGDRLRTSRWAHNRRA